MSSNETAELILADLRALVEQGRPSDAVAQLQTISAQDPNLGAWLTAEMAGWACQELTGGLR